MYWQNVKSKTLADPPYKPNPMKYKYLLQNTYPEKSNIGTQETPESPMFWPHSAALKPVEGGIEGANESTSPKNNSHSPMLLKKPGNLLFGDFVSIVNRELENF